MIRVLVVNDSYMVQQILTRIVQLAPGMEVASQAFDGRQAIELARTVRPDVILMDIRMPVMDGVAAVERIMRSDPCPIIVVTATLDSHMLQIYECLAHGALEVVKTPGLDSRSSRAPSAADIQRVGQELVNRIRVAANLGSALRIKGALRTREPRPLPTESRAAARPGSALTRDFLLIGASTGGPAALEVLLSGLPRDLDVGTVVIQHMDHEFMGGLADWLSRVTHFCVKPAGDGAPIRRGSVLLATGTQDLVLGVGSRLVAREPPDGALHVPSIDVTFASFARLARGRLVAVLLTGMGKDGALGLKAIRQAGGRTIAQDQATSVVFGMPGAAQALGAAEYVLPLPGIPGKVIQLLGE